MADNDDNEGGIVSWMLAPITGPINWLMEGIGYLFNLLLGIGIVAGVVAGGMWLYNNWGNLFGGSEEDIPPSSDGKFDVTVKRSGTDTTIIAPAGLTDDQIADIRADLPDGLALEDGGEVKLKCPPLGASGTCTVVTP